MKVILFLAFFCLYAVSWGHAEERAAPKPYKIGFEFQENSGLCSWAQDKLSVQKKEIFSVYHCLAPDEGQSSLDVSGQSSSSNGSGGSSSSSGPEEGRTLDDLKLLGLVRDGVGDGSLLFKLFEVQIDGPDVEFVTPPFPSDLSSRLKFLDDESGEPTIQRVFHQMCQGIVSALDGLIEYRREQPVRNVSFFEWAQIIEKKPKYKTFANGRRLALQMGC